MRKSGLAIPAAALLSGFFAASVAAHDFDRNSAAASPASFATAKAEPLAGNPLWVIVLGDLSETQARPLFSPSRRPPAPPVLAAVASYPVKLGPPAKSGPDHPLLTLLGTIVGDSVEIGVFTDEVSHDVVRLKAGEAHDGWTLRAIAGRSATFEKAGFRADTLVLPAPGAEAAAATAGNGRIRFAPPVSTFAPANTEGGSRRPPKEG
jgi:general secretion pathway protein N